MLLNIGSQPWIIALEPINVMVQGLFNICYMRSLFLIFFFCYVTGKAQDRACVVSEKDSIPLSNVYICLKDRRVIAISDEKGVFSLEKV